MSSTLLKFFNNGSIPIQTRVSEAEGAPGLAPRRCQAYNYNYEVKDNYCLLVSPQLRVDVVIASPVSSGAAISALANEIASLRSQ